MKIIFFCFQSIENYQVANILPFLAVDILFHVPFLLSIWVISVSKITKYYCEKVICDCLLYVFCSKCIIPTSCVSSKMESQCEDWQPGQDRTGDVVMSPGRRTVVWHRGSVREAGVGGT